jgi:hypothetical protein
MRNQGMRNFDQGRSRFGMSGKQIAFLAILAVLTFSVIIGSGYYVLSDSGLIGGANAELVGQSPATPTMTSTSEPSPSPTVTPEMVESNPLPATWTPTPTLTEAPIDTASWTLDRDDLTADFEATTLEELGIVADNLLFEGEYPLINIFSYIDSNEEFEGVYGWTFLIEVESDQADFDAEIQTMDLFTEQMIEDLSVEEVIDQQELGMPEDLGDSSRAITVVARIEDVDFRFDMVLFRRDAAGVYCVTIYLDGEIAVVPIQDAALKIDAHIQESYP